MSRFFPVISFGAVMLMAPGPLFPQSVGGGTFSSSMSAIGSGGSVSSRGNGAQITFTYNYPPGAMVYVIANAPYSGRMSSQNTRTLANGVHLNARTNDQPMTYRDAAGRTRTDSTMGPVPPGAPASFRPHLMRLPEINDPVAGFRYVLDDANRIAHRVTIQARQTPALPPSVRAPVVQPASHTMGNGRTLTTESLGTQAMSGITVTGQRTTTTYPPGTWQGNDGPLTSISETWRSEQYGLVLLSKDTQPDGNESSMTMKDFSAAEPDPTLFMVPAGYQIVDETGQFTITMAESAK